MSLTQYNSQIITSGSLVINSTTNASGVGTGGSLTVLGGASISKDLYVGTTITTDNLNIYGNLNTSFKSLSLNANNTIGSIITTGGNVGINTTSPSYTLDVNGTARFTNLTRFVKDSMVIYSDFKSTPDLTRGSIFNGSSNTIVWNKCSNGGGWSTSILNGAPGGHFVVGVTGLYRINFVSRYADGQNSMVMNIYYGDNTSNAILLPFEGTTNNYYVRDPNYRITTSFSILYPMTAGKCCWLSSGYNNASSLGQFSLYLVST